MMQLNNKCTLTMSQGPSSTAGRCFHKPFPLGETTFQRRKKPWQAPLRVRTKKMSLSLEYADIKVFECWARRIWRCSKSTYCTEEWERLILLAHSFASLANQQKFVTLFPGWELHQILMMGRAGIYIRLFLTIWAPQDKNKITIMTETGKVTRVLTLLIVSGSYSIFCIRSVERILINRERLPVKIKWSIRQKNGLLELKQNDGRTFSVCHLLRVRLNLDDLHRVVS